MHEHYTSQYTKNEVEKALGNALNPDDEVTSGSDNLVTSGAVADAVGGVEKKLSVGRVVFFAGFKDSGEVQASGGSDATPDGVYFYRTAGKFGQKVASMGTVGSSEKYYQVWSNMGLWANADGTPLENVGYISIEDGAVYLLDEENGGLSGITGGSVDVDSAITENGTNPVQGKAIYSALQLLKNSVDTKFGGISFVDGKLNLYTDAAKTNLVTSISLGATSYVISQGCDFVSGFYILSGEEEHFITITPTTLSSAFGTQNTFIENYELSIDIKSGTGQYRSIVSGATVAGGSYYKLDIRSLVSTGDNTIKISVEGKSSGVTVTQEYACVLTNLTFRCNFSWWKAWVGGTSFGIDNIYFYGNLAKTLKVRLDNNTVYQQVFSASTNYNTSSYSFNMSEKWTNLTTGIHNIDIWIEGGGASTQVISYRVMVVSAADKNTAKLVVINEEKNKAINYNPNTELFNYATYGTSSVTLNITATDGEQNFNLVSNQTLSVNQTQTKVDGGYSLPLSISSYVQTYAFQMSIRMSTSASSCSLTLPVDNTESFSPTYGSIVYFNFASRNNAQAGKNILSNEADNPVASTYEVSFSNMAWNKDGYTADSDGNVGLKMPAGSSALFNSLLPLAYVQTGSASVEFMFRASDVSDYNTPILSIMSTDTYNANSTNGIILFPTQLKVLSSAERRHTFQSYNLSEDDILHVVIVFHRNYAGTGNNICRIYVNACPVTNFEYSGISSFGNGVFKLGQKSADLHLYMFRLYDKAIESGDVVNNFLNALIENNEYSRTGLRSDNGIIDGGSISYELAKQKGFNCYVIETDSQIPSFNNNDTISSLNIRLEYADHPEWNVRICGIPMDGQGTTSMLYYRWNLRNNNKNSSAVWEYPNINGVGGVKLTETGKDGYIAGYGLHPKVSKITAKKNIASSSQGHKMGATNLYNDLWHKFFDGNLGTTKYVPSTDTRVSVYQYPFLGFKMTSDGGYEFIGLYTIGPDKTDKKTFSYDSTSTYPKLMMIEGPNHSPRATRFLTPWVNVEYDYSNKTLTFSGQEGWDADMPADYSSDKSSDAAAIKALYESEFKPAYDLIYYTSPYIRALSSTGKTIAQINADIDNFSKGTTGGYSNDLLSLYDSSFNLYYKSPSTNKFVQISGFNLKTYLGNYLTASSPTEQQVVNACTAKFKAEIGNYVSIDEALFHRCFTILIGASDNDAKNTYWRKFVSLANGGKWGFNQDDLDTILPSDNNGQSTKSYSIEPGDVTANGDDIFQGQTSAFWMRINISYQDEIRSVMKEMISKMDEISSENNFSSNTLHERILKVFSLYFWDSAAKYFPAIAYAEDTEFGYLTPWRIDHTKTYNSVEPLTQALGTQYNAELIWVQRRIAYVFSKYKIGGFGSPTGEYGQLTFTPSTANTASFLVKPAIDIYPRDSSGGAEPSQGSRTFAGETCVITPTSGDKGSTTFYLLGLDWYTSVGDLSSLVLTSRGGSSETAITFEISAKRLQELKVGDSTASNVKFNATSLNVSGNCLETIDARNASSIQGVQDLTNCPRLKNVYFSGTSVSMIQLPIGGKIENLSMPSTVTTLFFYSLSALSLSNIHFDSLENVLSLYINGCENINPIEIIHNICSLSNNSLKYITAIWSGSKIVTSQQLHFIGNMARNQYNQETGEGYGSVTYDATNGSLNNVSDKPVLEGIANLNGKCAYQSDIDSISETFPNLTVTNVGSYYIPFEDAACLSIVLANMGSSTDGIGITFAQAASFTGMSTTLLYGHPEAVSFKEFKYFTSVTRAGMRGDGLKYIEFPNSITEIVNYAFYGSSNLQYCDLQNTSTRTIGSWAFQYCRGMQWLKMPQTVTTIGTSAFSYCENMTQVIMSDNITSIGASGFSCCYKMQLSKLPSKLRSVGSSAFYQCKAITISEIPESCSSQDFALFECISITSMRIPSSWTTIPAGFMSGCTGVVTISNMHEGITEINADAFYKCNALTNISIPSTVKSIGRNAFRNCYNLVLENIPNGLEFIGQQAFRMEGSTYNYGITLSSLPETVTEIESWAFYGCKGLALTSLPSRITYIGAYCFNSCENLLLASLPSSITTIEEQSFAGCKLMTISALPSALTVIKAFAFDGCEHITISEIPSGVATISNGAFRNCTSIPSLTLHDGLVTIEGGSFQGCSGMQGRLTIPSTVTSIGTTAFNGCNGLTDIVVNATTPPSIANASVFPTKNIYVPSSSYDNYKIATGWADIYSYGRLFRIS